MRVLLFLLPVLLLAGAAAHAQGLRYELASPNEQGGGYFGYAVSGVADLDGDGRGDVIVGAVFEDPGTSPQAAGRAYVFSGATGALLHTLTSPNEEFWGFFGGAVAGVPDADGDGRGDLLVGATGEGDGGGPDATPGRAYVFSGATGALIHALASPNEEAGGWFGGAVAGVPDVDGDGAGDLLVGAYAESPGDSPDLAGRAYVFSGATGELIHELASPNEEDRGRFGDAVAGVPDVDGDGRGDVVVGAYGEDGGAENAGRAYLFSGSGKGTAVEGGAPAAFVLDAPRPNPFADATTVSFTLAVPSSVRVSVYDALGREVAVLAEGERAAGRHEVAFDASGLPAGVYLVRLEAGRNVAVRTLTLLR